MSLAAACAQTAQAIAHARSLFGDAAMAPEAAPCRLSAAATSSASAGTQMTSLSGSAVDAHRDFVDRAVPPLVGAARFDAELGGHLRRAVAVMQDGAARLDGIAAENRQTMALAVGAKTPAAQAAVVKLLGSQLDRTRQVISDASRQASGIAGGVQALDY